MSVFSLNEILAAHKNIHGTINYTPVLTSSIIDSMCDKKIYFKCEHLQKTGSFKARGALNAVRMAVADGASHVITHSSGNFGQALAWASKLHNIPCTVVTPKNAPSTKLAAMEGYGAKLVRCPAEQRAKVCEALRAEGNYELIDPFDDYRVMAGQGTVAVEFMEQVPDLDTLLIPVGGGGLASGMCTAALSLKPTIKVYCVEPKGKRLQESFNEEQRLWKPDENPVDTIADGIRVIAVGKKCFPELLRHSTKEVLTVDDSDIVDAMKLIYIYLKAIEPTAAVTLAALLKYPEKLSASKFIGLVLCGGNIDLNALHFGHN